MTCPHCLTHAARGHSQHALPRAARRFYGSLPGFPNAKGGSVEDWDVNVTHVTFHFIMLVAGQEIGMINLSRTVAAAYMQRNRLFLSVATTPKGYPVSRAMQASLSWPGGGRPQLYRNDPERDEPGVAWQPVR